MSKALKPLSDSLHRYLQPHGFRRRGLRWNRDVDGLVDVVTIQRTKSLDLVYVNLGVLDPEIHVRWWGRPPGNVPDEADCTVRARLGVIVDGHDRVWDPGDPDAPDDIERLLEEHGLPFLDSMHSRTTMMGYLEPRSREWPSAAYLALLKAAQGDRPGACATLTAYRDSLETRFRRWPRLEEVIAELGCQEE